MLLKTVHPWKRDANLTILLVSVVLLVSGLLLILLWLVILRKMYKHELMSFIYGLISTFEGRHSYLLIKFSEAVQNQLSSQVAKSVEMTKLWVTIISETLGTQTLAPCASVLKKVCELKFIFDCRKLSLDFIQIGFLIFPKVC